LFPYRYNCYIEKRNNMKNFYKIQDYNFPVSLETWCFDNLPKRTIKESFEKEVKYKDSHSSLRAHFAGYGKTQVYTYNVYCFNINTIVKNMEKHKTIRIRNKEVPFGTYLTNTLFRRKPMDQFQQEVIKNMTLKEIIYTYFLDK